MNFFSLPMLLVIHCLLLFVCTVTSAGSVFVKNDHYKDSVYLFNNSATFSTKEVWMQNTTLLPGKGISLEAEEGTVYYAWARGKPYQV